MTHIILRRLALPLIVAASMAVALPAPTQAALVDRGGGLVYDAERDLTWFVDPALLPGPMTQDNAAQFAADFEYAGGTDWLLPQAAFFDPGCAGAEGFGCIDSDMAHLFHQRLGGTAGSSVFDSSGDTAEEIANVALLPALAESWFWSWQIADDGGGTAFAFHFGNGLQLIRDSPLSGRVLLVRAGDLGTAMPVDSPPTLPLVLTAVALAG